MSEWIEWKGGECPVSIGSRVEVRLCGGIEYVIKSVSKYAPKWKHGIENYNDIVAYKVIEEPKMKDKSIDISGFVLKKLADGFLVEDVNVGAEVWLKEQGWTEPNNNETLSGVKTLEFTLGSLKSNVMNLEDCLETIKNGRKASVTKS